MKILIYGLNFAPELTGVGKYSGEMADWLAMRGHCVDVVTAPPYYPEWKIGPDYRGLGYRQEVVNMGSGKLRVLRCPIWVPGRVSGMARLLHLVSFALSSAPALILRMFGRPDLAVLVVPSLLCAPAALLGRWFGIPIWIHVQDFEVDAAFGLGIVRGNWRKRIVLSLEAFLLKRFSRVSSISPKMVERLHAKGVAQERTVLFPNWVDLNTIRPITGPNRIRKALDLEESHVLVMYAGSMGEKQGLELVMKAAEELATDPKLRFVFVGSGPARSKLERLTAGLANVRWMPLQPFDRLNELLNAADVHLLPQKADAADLVMPSKLTGMLASGRAVIGTAAAETQVGQLLDEVGIRVEPNDLDGLISSIRNLASDSAARQALGAKGRTYALNNLDRDRILERFLEEAMALRAASG